MWNKVINTERIDISILFLSKTHLWCQIIIIHKCISRKRPSSMGGSMDHKRWFWLMSFCCWGLSQPWKFSDTRTNKISQRCTPCSRSDVKYIINSTQFLDASQFWILIKIITISTCLDIRPTLISLLSSLS